MTPDEVVALAKTLGDHDVIMLHPMAGGFNPDLAWESLKLVEDKVLPKLAG